MIEEIKLLLGISDDKQDDLINWLIKDSKARLLSYINLDGNKITELPKDTEWIQQEIAISRFNKIGDEGKKSSTESDVTATWNNNDILDYAIYLDKYRKKKGGNGTARFF